VAVVEGRFMRRGVEVGAGRHLKREGRSRTYLDGAIASAAALDAATDGTVEIVGQHDQLAITRASEVRRLVDRAMDDERRTARETYASAWREWTALLTDREALGGDRHALERERAAARHDVEIIDSAGFTIGDDDELSTRLGRLRNAEQIRFLAAESGEAVQRILEETGRLIGTLRRARALDPGIEPAIGTAGGIESEAGELARDIADLLGDLDHEPEELEAAEQRQSQLGDLQRRYGPSLSDVLDFAASQRRRLIELEDLLARADRIEGDLAAARARLDSAGDALRQVRSLVGRELAEAAVGHLIELGFVRPFVEIAFAAADASADGADTATIRFASDDRLEAGPISRVASGGELSRLVLALRLAGEIGDTESLVFDEVDAGVGGVTAISVGEKLAALSTVRQVLCVTHLPQVAAYADAHWVVERDGNEAVVRKVDGPARVEELSRMLAGMPESERGRDAAEELLVRSGRA